MHRIAGLGIIGLCVTLACPPVAAGQALVEYEFAPFFAELSRQPELFDLIAFKDIGTGAFFEGGFVDPANGVEAFNFNYLGCLEQWDGVESTTVDPLDCFWHGYGDPGGCDPANHMLDLTDGTPLVAPVLRDFARAAAVFRYDFVEPTDIGEILVYTKNAGRDVRVFQHYEVYVSYDGSTVNLEKLATVTNGIFGASTNPGLYEASYTRVSICTGGALAAGVTKIRIVVYASGLGDLFMDPWRGYWHPDNSAAWLACEATYPADPEDLDGRQKPFVAPMIAEIDVLAPQAPGLPGDGDGDGDVDADDIPLFVGCVTGPEVTLSTSACIPFDLEPKDCDVDLADFAEFQQLFGF